MTMEQERAIVSAVGKNAEVAPGSMASGSATEFGARWLVAWF